MADIAAAIDDDHDADFSAGFEDKAPATTAELKAPEPAAQQPKPEAKTDAAAPVQPKETPAAPEYVQVTKEQFDRWNSAAEQVTGFSQKLDKALGTVGSVQQIVKELQSATPKGQAIDLPDDLMADLEKDYPELAGSLRKVFEKALKGRVGTNTDQPKDAKPDYEAVSKAVRDATIQAQTEALEDLHPTWRKIVGTSPQDDIPFRKWLATQPAEYQTKINSTNSATIIGRSIDKFLKAEAAQAPAQQQQVPKQATARRDRIAGAVQPRGDGGRPATSTRTDDESAAFEAGFAS